MRRIVTLLIGAAVTLGLPSCSAVQNQRGYVPNADAVDSIVVGQDTKASVSEKLGTPTVSGTFSNDIWYYISSHDVQTAFFAPYSTSRNIVAVEFSQTGQVSTISHYGLEDGRVVDYVDRETPTPGSDLTFLQQLLNAVPGNVGVPPQQIDQQNPGGGGGPPP